MKIGPENRDIIYLLLLIQVIKYVLLD